MTKYILLILSCITFVYANGQNRKERKQLYNSNSNYEIEMLGVGQDGTQVFKIWAYGSDVDQAIMRAKQLAVRACLFRGLPGSQQTNETPPICEPDAETKYSDYFQQFFAIGGSYLNYVNITTDGVPSGQDRLKIKKGYKVGLKVQILYDNLRRKMEQEGIAKRLDSLF